MRFGLRFAESFFLLSFTASLVAQTPAITLESATLTIDPQSRDSYTLQGAFSGLSFADSQAVSLKIGQFSGTIPIDKFVRQPGSNVLLYEDPTGLAPYWVSSLSLDLDARTFQAQAQGIVLAGLPNPFSVQLGADQISGCAMVRVQRSGDGNYQLSSQEVESQPCLIPGTPVVEPILAGQEATVTFNVTILPIPGLDPQSIRLYRVDDNAQPAGDPLCRLSGQGNGAYSCAVSFNEPAVTAIPLLVQAAAGTQTLLSPGFWLQVVRPGDDNDLKQFSAIEEAMSVWHDNFDQFGDSPHARVLTLAALRSILPASPGLTGQRVGLAPDGLSIEIRIDSGATIMLVLNRLPSRSPENPSATQVRPALARQSSLWDSRTQAPSPRMARYRPPQCGEFKRDVTQNNKILIWNADAIFFNEHNPERYLDALIQSKCPKFDRPMVINGADATPSSLDQFPAYGTILILSHGSIDSFGRAGLLTGDRDLRPAFSDPMHYGFGCAPLFDSPAPNSKALKALECFLKVFSNNPHFHALSNSIVLAGVCYSLALAPSLVPSGSTSAFYGYTGPVDTFSVETDAASVFEDLGKQYLSTGDAAEQLHAKLWGNSNLAYVGNPVLTSPQQSSSPQQGTTPSYATEAGGLLGLQAQLDGAARCDGVMKFHWKNTAVAGHLKPAMRGSGQDDFDGTDSTANYTADSISTPRTDQITVDFLPDPDALVAARACATVSPAQRGLGVSEAYIFSYQNDGPENPKTFSPPRDVGAPYDLQDGKFGASSSANVRQVSANKWEITQKATGAPASQNPVVSTWNRLDLQLVHRPGPRRIRVKVNSSVSGTCQGLDVSLGAVRHRKDGNNGCSDTVTLETLSGTGPTASTLLLIRFVVLGGRGTSFGPGSGTVTTEVEFLSDSTITP